MQNITECHTWQSLEDELAKKYELFAYETQCRWKNINSWERGKKRKKKIKKNEYQSQTARLICANIKSRSVAY